MALILYRGFPPLLGAVSVKFWATILAPSSPNKKTVGASEDAPTVVLMVFSLAAVVNGLF